MSGALLVNPPAEARAWALDAGMRLAPFATGAPNTAQSTVIHQPAEGTTVYLAPETGASDLVIRATSQTSSRITFRIDGQFAGEVASGTQFIWEMSPGIHTLEAIGTGEEGNGTPARVTFEVKGR